MEKAPPFQERCFRLKRAGDGIRLSWHTLVARHRLGAAVILASAALIAASARALPVYEIYKVGEALHWHDGLDFFGPYGLSWHQELTPDTTG